MLAATTASVVARPGRPRRPATGESRWQQMGAMAPNSTDLISPA